MKKIYIVICVMLALLPALSNGQIISWNFTSGNAPNLNLPGGATALSFNTGGSNATSGCNGNGFSTNNWNVNEYMQIAFSTVGYNITTVNFDIQGSNTGPRNFKFQYSSTGTGGPFTDLGTTFINPTSCATRTGDFTAINALDNNANAVIRLVFTGGEADGSPASGDAASGGTFRIDDLEINGSAAVSNSITTTAITAGSYPVTSGGEAITVSSGTINAKGIAWGLSAASIAALPIPGAAETEGRWHVAASGTASFAAPLAGVQPGTTIYYRAYYTTSGPTATVLGDVKSYVVPSKGTSLAFWNFGPDGDGYTEAPASTVLSAVTFTPATGTGYDNNGKDGFIYNGAVRGQAFTWDNASTASNYVIRLNTTGYQGLHFRADYLAQTGGTYTLAYSTDGLSYTNITTSGAIPTNMTVVGAEDYNWGTIYHDLSGIAAFNNAANVYLRLTLNSGVSNQLEFDNIHIFGTVCNAPAQPGTISGITTPVCSGTTQTYSITAVSGATSYTWALPGGWTGTSTTNSITATVGATGGTVSVTANNACGSSAARISATIVVNPTPADPTGTITPAANPACGSTLLTYDNAAAGIYWQTTAAGTSTANPSTTPYNATTTGTYYVRAFNGSCWSAGALASAVITIHTAPSISVHPSATAQNVCSGLAVTGLSVTAAGTGIGYQWYSNATNSNVGGTLIPSATSATYTPSNTLIGTTYYYCVVTGTAPCTAVTSNVSGAITINPPAADPAGVITGSNSSCGPTVINYSAYTGIEYWQTTSGGTSTANPVVAGGNRTITASGNYYVRSRTAAGCWSTGQVGPFTVTIGAAAGISVQPADITVTSPAAASFTVTAANVTGYQWQYYNGTAWVNLANVAPYAGVTTATLAIASTTAAMDGTDYRCVLSAAAPCTSVNTAAATLYVNPGPCMDEKFNNIPTTNTSSYLARSWTGDMGGTWSATDARTDQTINGKAITIRNGILTSPSIANGIGSITMSTDLPFSDAAGNLTVRVNGNVAGTIPYSTSGVLTTTIPGINISGTVQVTVESTGDRVSIDNLSWTCYTSCTPTHTITALTPSSGPVGTRVTITGTGFTGISNIKIGETTITGYTVVNATTIIAQIPAGASSGKIVIFKAACPVSSAGNFSVLTNNGNCNSAAGATPSDLMISEIFDSPSGSYGYIEIYNGTNGSISLSNYKLRRESEAPIGLSGTIDPGETAVFEYGGSGTRCGAGSYPNLTTSGFNEDDDIQLLKGAGNTIIDRLTTPGYVGYSYARTSTIGAPTATFDASQWTDTNTGCANIGSTDFVITPIITVNTHPADKECLEPVTFSVAAVANPNPVSSYRWMYNNPAVAGSGWAPVSGLSIAGVNFAGTNTATLTITGYTAGIRNYQFYCELTKDLALDCIVQSNAAQYRYDSKLYYKANVASGSWTTPGSWLMSDNAAAGFVAACTYPVAANSDAVIIPAGTKILHNADLLIDIDKVTIETGGELEIASDAGLKIFNGGSGADLTVNGTLIDNASSGAGNGIDYEDNAGTANDASWTLGAGGTIIKTNNSSAASYRDFYAGGIATIPATGNWIYRYIGTGTPAVVAADMYYPNLSFESASGAYSWNTATTALTGAASTMNVKGSLLIGNAGSGTVNVYYNNINATPMQVGGSLLIGAGSTLTNVSYDNTVTSSRGHGTGFDIKGNLTVNGTLTNNGGTTQTGMLRFSGTATQTVSGSGSLNLEDVDVATTGASGNVLNNISFAIPGTLSFGSAGKLSMGTGNITLSSTAARTANVDIIPATASILYPGAGKFIVERYISFSRKWQLLSVPANSTQSIFESWQEGGSNAPGYGVKITGPVAANGLDAASAGASMKYQAGTTIAFTGITATNTPNSLNTSSRGYYVYVYGDRTAPVGGGSGGVPTTLRTTGKLFIGNGVAGEAPPAINLPAAFAQNISISNPFASAINFATLRSAATNLSTDFKVWDPSQGGTYGAGIYQTISGVTGWQATPGAGSLYNVPGNYSTIQSGQAFFVQAASTANINVPFAENIKVSGSRLVQRGGNEEPQNVDPTSISMLSSFVHNNSTGNLMDGNRVVFDPIYSNAVDENDAVKIMNDGINFGISKENRILAVEARPDLTADDTIHYQLSSLTQGQYQLRIAVQNINEPLLQAELVDRFLGNRTPVSLRDSSFINFTVTADAASSAVNRFYLVFKQVTIVPVTFTSIRATRKENKTVDVSWNVENEFNMNRYEVERSSNGSSFTKLGEQSPLYNGAGGQYTFNDATAPHTVLYYRIKGISINGQVQYSAIVKVDEERSQPSFVIYPNPATGKQVNVQLAGIEAGAAYELSLYDAAGKLVHAEKIKPVQGTSTVSLRLKHELAVGTYRLQVSAGKKETILLSLTVK